MRIKEFLINRYGPLSFDKPVRLGNFNLLWGNNEHGKTLTLEALVKILLGKNTKDFNQIDRVEEYPSGYAIIEDSKGKEIKLPDRGSLNTLMDLSASECRNIFIIRNSELMIENEDKFYIEVTERLTGLRTSGIKRLQDILRNHGGLTPTGSFRNIGSEKLKSRLDEARETIEGIGILIEKVNREDLENLEKHIVEKREEILGIDRRLILLDEARRREQYKKGEEAFGKLERAREELELLEIFNDNDLQLWQESENTEINAKEEIVKCNSGLKENENLFESQKKQRQERETDFTLLSKHKEHIDSAVKPSLGECGKESEKLVGQEALGNFWHMAFVVSAALSAISLIVSALHGGTPLYVLTGALFIFTLFAGIMNYRLQKTKSKVAKLLASINMELSKFELESDSIEGINSNIQKLEDSHDKMFKEIREMQRKETILEERIKNLRERDIPREEKRIRDSREKIDDIVEKSGVKLLSAYKERLSTKRVCDISINKSASILESHFKKPSGVLSENVDYWNQEISKLENYKNKGQDIDYDESVVEKFKSERIEANAKLGSWTDAMKSFQRELEEIENRVQRCLDLVADHVPCRTTLDLEPSRSRLESFVKESENSRENVLGVVKILDEINNKEQEKVLELFGEQSSITEYYRDITDGLYEEVVFNRQEKIQVKRRDGKLIEASKLSGGAYDQLYFSIRLALGNKILKGDPGFFIVDDPFIKADPERLGRQMDMLKKICAQRWQIIYFSAKGEVKDILADDIAKGAVNLVAIDNVYV